MAQGSVDASTAVEVDEGLGGETACWAHLVCLECGALITEGHREGCPLATGGGTGEALGAPYEKGTGTVNP
jgi:hypothetical protein